MVLVIDGVRLEKGNKPSWILKGYNTKQALLAKNLAIVGRDSITLLLKRNQSF